MSDELTVKEDINLHDEKKPDASSGPNARNVGIRLLYGIGIGAFIVGLLAYGGFWLMVLAVVAATLGLREFFCLTKCDKPRTIFPLRRLGYIFVIALLVLTYYEPLFERDYFELLLVLFIISALVYQMGRFSMEKANFLYELAITLLGGLYIGGLISFALRLWNLGEGYAEIFPILTERFAVLPLVPLVGAWGYDTAAFFSGSLFGKMKLMPSVSPRKSIEGAIGGVVGAGTAMLIFGYASGTAPQLFTYPYLFALGVMLGILSQVGDLCVSALKREMAAKDASGLIPGHGGILDKIDGLLFCLPAAYYILLVYLENLQGG